MGDVAMAAAAGDAAPAPRRKLSLASQLETMAQTGAFLRAIEENRPEVDVCRAILLKRPGRRSLDDIHLLKSLLGTSKLLEFFSNLDAYKIDKLYQSIELGVFEEKGTYVFEQDDPGDSFYMVFRGQVEIRQRDPHSVVETSRRRTSTSHIALLNPGDSFGERALLYESDRRAASAIVASEKTELVFINRTVFTDLLKESQEADATGTTLEITKRFRSNKDIIRNMFMRASAQRSEKDLKFAVEYLKSVKFFARFSFEVRKQLCKAMKLISAVTNTVLFEEGQEGRHFYIIFSGSVEVSVRTKNRFDETSENVVSRLGEGEYFGELALSESGGLRRATVTCADFCELLVLGRDQYEPLIKKYQNEYHAQYAKMLSTNPYFIGPEWDDYTIQAMCAVMAEKYFPFRGEICKQGSRATEMFVVTRGECVMIHEGKHPITGQPQQYELGRFGPNSVLGCAEASAGRFNDINIRDYSIIAESPVRILVLSRFDIFHLMSPTARESLQRSSAGSAHESIENRALKTVTWERYRKDFLASILANRDQGRQTIGAGRGPTKTLSTSCSVPVMGTIERPLKTLLEPGAIVLVPRGVRSNKGKPKSGRSRRGPLIPTSAAVPSSTSSSEVANQKTESPTKLDEELFPLSDTVEKRRNTVQPASEEQGVPSHRVWRPSVQVPAGSPIGEEETKRIEGMPAKDTTRGRRHSMVKSKTLAILDTQPAISTAMLPAIFSEKPLYASSSALPNEVSSAPVGSSSSDRRHSVRLRSEAHLNPKPTSAARVSASTIWNPIHGVCQPFAVVGFMREQVKECLVSARSVGVNGAVANNYSAVSSARTPTASAVACSAGDVNGMTVITAFRVFGKFTELHEALDLFRHVCSLETVPPADGNQDTSRFAIYKEDEITMTMENYFNSPNTVARPYQYRALDLPHGNGQRFACVSINVEWPARIVENVAVYVYQCFPTPQSAVRFARQMSTLSLATMTLYVIPLFEWVPLAEMERFDAKSADLEQALEAVTLVAGSSGASASGKPISTWKARKEAVKKARLHALKHA